MSPNTKLRDNEDNSRRRKPDTVHCWGGTGGGGHMTEIESLHSRNPRGNTHLLILPETLSALSLFFLNILPVGQAEIPQKSLSLSRTPSWSLQSSPFGSHSFLSLWSLSDMLKNTHTNVSTAAAPPRQVNRCDTAPTSTQHRRGGRRRRRTGLTSSLNSSLLPFLFVKALKLSPLSRQGP